MRWRYGRSRNEVDSRQVSSEVYTCMLIYIHTYMACAYIYIFTHRILFAEHRIKEKLQSHATSVFEDAMLARAQCHKELILDRMERISTVSNVSRRKHDRTCRKWFKDILNCLIGKPAFDEVGLDLSADKLKTTKETRWKFNRANHWKPCTRRESHPHAPSFLRMDEVCVWACVHVCMSWSAWCRLPLTFTFTLTHAEGVFGAQLLEQWFKEFVKVANRGMSMTKGVHVCYAYALYVCIIINCVPHIPFHLFTSGYAVAHDVWLLGCWMAD